MKKADYVIEVRDSSKKIIEHRIPTGTISERRLETLVAILTAKYGKLDDDEIIGSMLNPKSSGYRPLLEINKHAIGPHFGWMCGMNPHLLVTTRPAE